MIWATRRNNLILIISTRRRHIQFSKPISPFFFGAAAAAALVLFNSSSTSSAESGTGSRNNQLPTECDFIVVGNGLAGKSAVRILERFCPRSSIVVVDPHSSSSSSSSTHKNTCYISQAVLQLDTASKQVRLSSQNDTLHYKHSILIATGSRGAPPPMSLFDSIEAFSRVLELRSTILPMHCSSSSFFPDGVAVISGEQALRKQAAIPPMAVRALSIAASSQNANLTILGSGMEALELAAAAAQRRKKTNNSIALVFGNAGPLAAKIPRYLSTEITKRLQQQIGIDVYNRYVVRYVSSPPSGDGALELHLAKVSDSIDTKRLLNMDLLVVAPSVDQSRGSAFLPYSPVSVASKAWSNMVINDTLTCHSSDGRVMVNAEFSAARDVYAAGSVARCPNHSIGRPYICGGSGQSETIGEIAATYMVAQYYNSRNDNLLAASFQSTASALTSKVLHYPMPIMRTDRISYAAECSSSQQQQFLKSALSSIGVHALFVGDCNSEENSTHGFWWTNNSSIRRDREQQHGSSSMLNYIEDSEENDSNTSEDDEGCNNTESIKLLTRATVKLSSSGSYNHKHLNNDSSCRPVYGSGVVFYLDRLSGKVVGVMTWGIPFTESSSDEINDKLYARIRRLIETNGKSVSSNNDSSSLLVSDLAEESKRIMTVACSDKTITENIFRLDGTMAKPLHRFVSATRRNHLNGEHLEDHEIYVRRTDGLEGTFLSQNDGLSTPTHLKNRPPKEDLLWVRQNDASRLLSAREANAERFYRNIRQGRFFDGTDPVERMQHPIRNSISRRKTNAE